MSENQLEKRPLAPIKDKGQYLIAFGIVASMLLVANIPIFVVFFFGVFVYLLLRMFASSPRNDTRDIFEFYLAANEILRDDGRRWFGFEINETILRGEELVHRMTSAPPLLRYALGALYHKAGDYKLAVRHLSHVLENEKGDESAVAFPTPELRNYVKVLRKIEREPADAPLTSNAVRSLERSRKLRGPALLEESRTRFAHTEPARLPEPASSMEIQRESASEPDFSTGRPSITEDIAEVQVFHEETHKPDEKAGRGWRKQKNGTDISDGVFVDRKPISEVLHDIYDKNVQ